MTRQKTETRTIQTWPGGASFEYRGDPDGPVNQRSLRQGHYQARLRCSESCREVRRAYHEDDLTDARLAELDGKYCTWDASRDGWLATAQVCPTCKGAGYVPNPKRNPWRKGTADEWRTIKINLRALIYQERDILCCDSSLVDDLIKASQQMDRSQGDMRDLSDGFSYDEIRNIYADPSDWDTTQCRDWLDDHGVSYDECPGDPECKGANDPSEDCAEHGDSDEAIDTLRELVRDYASEHAAEPYEWWRVSSWLCDQLHAIGEVTIDNGYGHWWGRTCTGQQFIMDGTLQQIAARFD